MHLSQTSLSIAGGVILFMIAIRMVFAKLNGTFGDEGGRRALHRAARHPAHRRALGARHRDAHGLARPVTVGMWAAAITVTMLITTVVLLAGTKLHRWLGDHAMHAIERLMGLILTAIAVEMLLAGIREFVKGL